LGVELCPHLIFLPLNFEKYGQKAEEVREVLVKYDPRYEAGSCDEAFLNITKVSGSDLDGMARSGDIYSALDIKGLDN
jgi:nucleotidyltransferase/DNA polymerase involved in DNA repair